ncbi:MAG: hypothetical protein DMG25_04890, partial [Acidobacteria bacterium]
MIYYRAYLVPSFIFGLAFLLWPARGPRSGNFVFSPTERRVVPLDEAPEVFRLVQYQAQPQGAQQPKIGEVAPGEGLPAVILDAGHGGQ